MASIRSQSRLPPLDPENLRLHAIFRKGLLRLLTAAARAASGSVAAIGLNGSFHLVDYDCHHSTSN
jgi:hypothetical protein